jgi:DNA-binding NarL/FixJ family response regulator
MKIKPVILIVDDNANFVDRMIVLLEEVENTRHIAVAGNYDEARRLLVMENPDVVVLDINLPGKNGIELLKLIREHNHTCEVIMLTNHTDEYYRLQCRELGAKHFLDKSSDFGLVPILISRYRSGN